MSSSICLSMIVKDEAENIIPLLESARPWISAAVFVDTGSTDNTVEVIREYLAKENLPGEVVERAWVDFATNRNQALDLATGRADYILALDADWIMEVDDSTMLKNLTADCYMYKIKIGGAEYYNERLLRDGLDWRWVHPVHEQPESDKATTYEKLEGVCMNVQSTGGFRTDRYRRDIKILEKELHKNPHDDHTLFYLANSYLSNNQPVKAQDYFKRLVRLNHERNPIRAERMYVGYYKLAELATKDEDKLRYLQAASLLFSRRLEAAYELMRLLQKHENWEGVYQLSKTLVDRPVPELCALPIAMWVYEWGIKTQYVEACLALGKRDEAIAGYEMLLEVPSMNTEQREIIQTQLDDLKSTFH